jgi:hypothetical protein
LLCCLAWFAQLVSSDAVRLRPVMGAATSPIKT